MDRNANKFDKEVKERLKEEVNFVPDNINKAFDEALLKVQATKKRRKYRKVAGMVAIFLGVSLAGVSMTPYAKNIPGLRNIYEIFNRKTYENYDKYASDINITKESNGIGVTINKVIYDGFDLEVFYTVESKEPMKATPHFINYKIKINGEGVSFGWGSGGEFIEDNRVYVGHTNYNINSRRLLEEKLERGNKTTEVPDEFILSLEINNVEFTGLDKDIYGKWYFDIPVSNEKLKGEVKEIDVNFDLGSIQEGLTVNKIITTPINTIIQGYDNYTDPNNILNFTIFDDKGRALTEKTGEGSGTTTENGEFIHYFSKSFKEVYDDIESISIIPSVLILPDAQNTTDDAKNKKTVNTELVPKEVKLITIPLNLQGETKLKTADGEDYGTITKVEIKEDRTYIHFKPTIGSFNIFEKIVDDKNDIKASYPVDNYYRNEETTTRYNKETGEFVIEFTKPLTDGSYSISYYDNSGSEVYFFDKVITVDVR